jgi:hypothetical protein
LESDTVLVEQFAGFSWDWRMLADVRKCDVACLTRDLSADAGLFSAPLQVWLSLVPLAEADTYYYVSSCVAPGPFTSRSRPRAHALSVRGEHYMQEHVENGWQIDLLFTLAGNTIDLD